MGARLVQRKKFFFLIVKNVRNIASSLERKRVAFPDKGFLLDVPITTKLGTVTGYDYRMINPLSN